MITRNNVLLFSARAQTGGSFDHLRTSRRLTLR